MRRLILILMMATLGLSCAHKQPENFYFGNYSEAEALYNRGQYDKAIQKYQAYVDENPEGNLAIIAQYYIAKSHMALGHYEDAERIFKTTVEKHPDMVWANFSETQLKELDKLRSQKQADVKNVTPMQEEIVVKKKVVKEEKVETEVTGKKKKKSFFQRILFR